MRRIALAVLLLGLAASARALKTERLFAGGLGPAAAGGISQGGMEVAAEEVLVRFSTTATAGQKSAVLTVSGGLTMNAVALPGWFLITLSSGSSVVPVLNALPSMPGVLQVVPNRIIPFAAFPSDPLVSSQYNLSNTGAFAAWDFGTASTGKTTIAMIDTGIDGTHPDLAAKIVNAGAIRSQDITNAGVMTAAPVPTDSCGHGTQTASVAAAVTNNGAGIAGVAWGAQLISLNVFKTSCAGSSDLAVATAIDYAANTLQNDAAIGKLIVNMSLGGPGACTTNPLTQAALSNLVTTKGVPASISSGNNGAQQCTDGGNQGVDGPANCAGVAAAAGIVPVGATNSFNQVSNYSCRGAELNSHGVTAPGDSIPVDSNGGGTGSNTGTSFSAPFVAGLMAMMLSHNQALTPAQIESYIRSGAYSIGGQSLDPLGNASGAGQVNLLRTMRLTVNGSLAGFDGENQPIAFPNPFKPSQSGVITFAYPASLQGESPTIKIYTLDGQLVKSLNGLTWNGKNTEGTPVASGTYVFVVSTSAGIGRGRFSVLR